MFGQTRRASSCHLFPWIREKHLDSESRVLPLQRWHWMAAVWSVNIHTAFLHFQHFPPLRFPMAIMEWRQCSLSCAPGGLLERFCLGSVVAAVNCTLSHEHSVDEEGHWSCRGAQLQKQSCAIVSKARCMPFVAEHLALATDQKGTINVFRSSSICGMVHLAVSWAQPSALKITFKSLFCMV